jgi:hypothetical protein
VRSGSTGVLAAMAAGTAAMLYMPIQSGSLHAALVGLHCAATVHCCAL